MEATKGIVIFLIIVIFASVPAQSANQPEAAQISSTHTASCLVKITFDPLVLSLDSITIDYLLHSTSVGGRITREILGISPELFSDIFIIETLGGDSGRGLAEPLTMRRATPKGMNEYDYEMMRDMERVGREYTASTARPGSSRRTSTTIPPSPVAEQTILFKLAVNLPENIKPVAEEFMYALVEGLRSALVNVFEDYKLRFENQLRLAEQEAARAESDLREKQKTLREISRSHALDRDQILAEIYRLRQEVQTARMSQASNQVIIDATTKRISEIQIKIAEQLENDAISIEQQKIIDLIGKLLVEAEKQAKVGRITTSQVDEIKEKLARARIEKATRRESLSKSLGGNLIESLNKELADRSIQATQQEASLASLDKQLVEAESLLAKADDYELLSLKAEMAKQSLQEAILWRDRTSRQIRLLQLPMVSILGVE